MLLRHWSKTTKPELADLLEQDPKTEELLALDLYVQSAMIRSTKTACYYKDHKAIISKI